VEVKNVTYRRGESALFPDAVTERGARHLEDLRRIVDSGERAAMLFVVNRDDCRVFAPAADIDPHYAALLAEVARCGVEVLAYAVDVSLEGLCLYRPLRIQLEK
jgi:sugar fermentation stimulation protein A